MSFFSSHKGKNYFFGGVCVNTERSKCNKDNLNILKVIDGRQIAAKLLDI